MSERNDNMTAFKKSLEKKSMAELRDMFNDMQAEQTKTVVEDEIFIRNLRKNFLGRDQI